MEGNHWNKGHRQVLYKGVDITDKIGLCICDECTARVRGEVDALLKAKELAATDSQQLKQAIALVREAGSKCIRADDELMTYGLLLTTIEQRACV